MAQERSLSDIGLDAIEFYGLAEKSLSVSHIKTTSIGWIRDALTSLERLAELSSNWDGFDSPPPTSSAVEVTKELLLIADECFPKPHVVPVPGGGVQLEWICGTRELEIEVSPAGDVSLFGVFGDSPDSEFQASLSKDAFSKALFQLSSWLSTGVRLWEQPPETMYSPRVA